MQLQGKVALVTGAAKRVGRAIALELARAGCDIGLHYFASQESAAEVAQEIHRLRRRCATLGGDLNEPSNWPLIVNDCVSALGRLDVLVNNASIFHADGSDALETFDADLWDRTLRVNVTSVAGLIHHAARHLCANGAGCVINLTDAGIERPFANHLAYSTSKAGLVALTKALARRLAPQVRVNAVAPGIAVFPDSYDDATQARLVERIPLQRAGTPEDIAKLVRFLVEEGDYITGAVIPVDGGRSVI
ncbi:MAG: SDR family oxidoreductase [Planctomycetes bacterium]|nr:SDR family oxidoreductase [Planctomycetota bacterium]MBI3836068.1 SDR family oxidoreductase [Planctomycetota bacterium]